MTGLRALAAIAAAAFLAAGCGEAHRRPAPDLRGERLDLAEDRLDDLGLRYEAVGGGVFGVVVRSHWIVCSQEPGPGRLTTRVQLYVDRDCWS